VFTPNGANRAIYDELFSQYQQLYHSLAGVYAAANGKRFTEEIAKA